MWSDITPAALAPVPSVAPITLEDERTLDPCSLLDVAALAPVVRATIRPGHGYFSSCTAVVPVPAEDEEIHIDVELMNGGTVEPVDPALRDPLDPVAVPGPYLSRYGCERYVLLPDGHVISVRAVLYGDTYLTEFCALADATADVVIDRLMAGRYAPRTSDADRSALAGLRACDLLDQDSVAAAVTAAGSAPPAAPTDGAAGWSCDSGPVQLAFMRESSTGAPDFWGDPVTIGGRPGMTRTDWDGGNCRAYVPQRFFVAEDGGMRAEYVRVHVEGSADTTTICRTAIDVAERVAARLPPFG